MNDRQFQIAIENARSAEARAHLERIKPQFEEACELNRTFADRINASKAARGEAPTKLRKTKREEVADYAKDEKELEEKLASDFAKLPGESVVWALSSALKTDISFWSAQGLQHTHPAERPIVEESIQSKRRLRESLEEFLRLYPPKWDDEG